MRLTDADLCALEIETMFHAMDCDCDDCDAIAEEDLQRSLDRMVFVHCMPPPTDSRH